MSMYKHSLCTLAVAALVAPAMAADENWTTDLPAALKQAGEEGKLVLVDFNGSDWCGPCITLKQQVFDRPEFLEYAKDKFVLVDVDLPRGDKVSAEQKQINQALAQEFTVSGFPTVLVLNAKGYALGGFVGGRADVGSVIKDLDAAIANKAKYAAADSLEGVEKAKALYGAHKSIQSVSNPRLVAAVLELDKDDTLGLLNEEKMKQQIELRKQEFQNKLQLAGNNHQAWLEIVSAELETKDLPVEMRPELLNLKANILISLADSVDDLMLAKAAYEEFATLSPNPERTTSQIEKMFADPAALLEEVRTHRAQQGSK